MVNFYICDGENSTINDERKYEPSSLSGAQVITLIDSIKLPVTANANI